MARFVLEIDTADYDSDLPDGQTIAGQIGYALSKSGGQISRVGIDANDPRPVLDINGNTIGEYRLNRPESADANRSKPIPSGQSGRYRCTCGYGPTTWPDRDRHILEMSKVNDTVEHRPVR